MSVISLLKSEMLLEFRAANMPGKTEVGSGDVELSTESGGISAVYRDWRMSRIFWVLQMLGGRFVAFEALHKRQNI